MKGVPLPYRTTEDRLQEAALQLQKTTGDRHHADHPPQKANSEIDDRLPCVDLLQKHDLLLATVLEDLPRFVATFLVKVVLHLYHRLQWAQMDKDGLDQGLQWSRRCALHQVVNRWTCGLLQFEIPCGLQVQQPHLRHKD
jgi:hypothetical protein